MFSSRYHSISAEGSRVFMLPKDRTQTVCLCPCDTDTMAVTACYRFRLLSASICLSETRRRTSSVTGRIHFLFHWMPPIQKRRWAQSIELVCGCVNGNSDVRKAEGMHPILKHTNSASTNHSENHRSKKNYFGVTSTQIEAPWIVCSELCTEEMFT